MEYIGFWKRFLAYVLDIIPIYLVVVGIAYFLLGFDQTLSDYMNGDRSLESRVHFLSERNKVRDTTLLIWILYGLFMDCSKFQGTHGKIIMGIIVVNKEGGKITLNQSVIRALMKIVGAVPIFLGYVWAGFRKDKAAWHDMAAKTRVVSYVPKPPPFYK